MPGYYGGALQGLLRPHDRRPRQRRPHGQERDFDAALDAFCDDWNRGINDHARFEKEYLLAVGTRDSR